MLFRTALSLVKQCGEGKKPTPLASQPYHGRMCVPLLPLFQLDQELAGGLEEWKGKVNNTESA